MDVSIESIGNTVVSKRGRKPKEVKEGKEVKVQAKKVVLLQNLEVQALLANQRNHI